MSEEREPFLARWSRLKTKACEAPGKEAPKEASTLPAAGTPSAEGVPPSAPLPAVDQLTAESDFKPFMQPQADPAQRRAALKKLFADSRFNVPDPFEAYSEDYTGGEPLPLEMLKRLNQAKRLLFDEAEQTAQGGEQKATEQPGGPDQPQGPQDGAGRQDA